MTLLISVAALIAGIAMGVCLHRFYLNGWIPQKYLKPAPDKAGNSNRIRIPSDSSSNKTRQQVYKTSALA